MNCYKSLPFSYSPTTSSPYTVTLTTTPFVRNSTTAQHKCKGIKTEIKKLINVERRFYQKINTRNDLIMTNLTSKWVRVKNSNKNTSLFYLTYCLHAPRFCVECLSIGND